MGGFGHVAQAETAELGGCNIFNWNTNNCVIDVLGSLVNGALGIASWILALSGYVLNFSMKLTLNIKTFVENTEAIYLVWKSIRDISGMFIIFTLLFAAIKMILAPIGVPGPSVGNLIKTVVMAGILINFSFFITGLGIDVSNIVSSQLYKVIAPESSLSKQEAINPSTVRAGLDGGISDIFMSSLKIQKLYENGLAADPNNPQQNGAVTTIKVIWAGVIGIIIMITSAISFLLAALALIVRFVILIFLLGFSPIWLAAYAVPDLKPYADKWTETYKGQLLFMPVYLLLLYFGLSVLSSANLFWSGNFAGASWQENLLVFGINAVFVIVMLNAPLLAAISVGGKMTKWMDRGLDATAIWSKVGGWARSASANSSANAWRNTGGRIASRVARSDAFQTFAGNSYVGELALKASRKVGKDFDTKLDERIKSREDFGKSLNRSGAVAYADRLFTQPPSNVINKFSMMGAIGRADRVAAASILTNRAGEIKTEIDKLTSELRKLQNTASNLPAGAALLQSEQDRLDRLTGTNIGGNNGGNVNEIADAQNDFSDVQRQISNFQAQTGSTAKNTTKRKY